MGIEAAPNLMLVQALYGAGADAYRRAVAATVAGEDPAEHWDRWEQITASLLLITWATGAQTSLHAIGLSPSTKPIRFDKGSDIAMRFEPGPAREVVRRLSDLLPITRPQWDRLILNAQGAARELRTDEQANALREIAKRSPNLAALLGLADEGNKPREVPGQEPTPATARARTPAVQAVAQGSFFVTGMNQRQIKQTRELLGQVIRGEESVSTAGKKIATIGVGDFVSKAMLETGTDLTAARLETVYRTNLNRAQTQGQLDIVREPTVRKFVPLMRFSATKDSRTRPTHKAMNGYIATVEQIDSQGIPTPGGFNCRCAWTPIPLAEAVRSGWCDENGKPNYTAIKAHNGSRQGLIDSGQFPDPGFISG